MLKRHSEFFLTLFLISDLILISASWVVAYAARSSGFLIQGTHHLPPLSPLSLAFGADSACLGQSVFIFLISIGPGG